MTTQEVATRYDELAQQEKFIDIQDELFADHVKSVEPADSPYLSHLPNVTGKAAVRKKAMEFVAMITDFHGASTTSSVTAGDHFAVGRKMDVTVEGLGRVSLDEVMLYKVEGGKIVLEQFFY